MKFTLILLFSAFLIGIGAAVEDQKFEKKTYAKKAIENDDSSNIDGSFIEASAEDLDKVSPELKSQIALMEKIKVKAAAVNPANLISAILKTSEDQLISALPTLHELTELLEGTPLGVFLHNLEIVVTDGSPYLWDSVIESYPKFVGSITEVGEKLAGLANTEADQLTIFNEKEMGLRNLFPVADVFSGHSFSQPGQDETNVEEIVSDNVGQTAAALKKPGKRNDGN